MPPPLTTEHHTHVQPLHVIPYSNPPVAIGIRPYLSGIKLMGGGVVTALGGWVQSLRRPTPCLKFSLWWVGRSVGPGLGLNGKGY